MPALQWGRADKPRGVGGQGGRGRLLQPPGLLWLGRHREPQPGETKGPGGGEEVPPPFPMQAWDGTDSALGGIAGTPAPQTAGRQAGEQQLRLCASQQIAKVWPQPPPRPELPGLPRQPRQAGGPAPPRPALGPRCSRARRPRRRPRRHTASARPPGFPDAAGEGSPGPPRDPRLPPRPGAKFPKVTAATRTPAPSPPASPETPPVAPSRAFGKVASDAPNSGPPPRAARAPGDPALGRRSPRRAPAP